MNERLYNVIDARADLPVDGPFRSMFAANEAANIANRIARENGEPARFFVREVA